MSKPITALAACVAGMTLSAVGLVVAQEPATQPAPSTQPTADAIANEPDPKKKSILIMRQIGQAIILYANDNRGSLPADLELLSKHRYLRDGFLTNLQNPQTGGKPGYDYVSPGQRIHRIKDAATVPMLWELHADGKRVDGGLVLYVDCHVEAESAKP